MRWVKGTKNKEQARLRKHYAAHSASDLKEQCIADWRCWQDLSHGFSVADGLIEQKLGKNMVPGDLPKLLGEHSKMALSASPDAAGAMQDLFASRKSGCGLLEWIRKFFNP